MIIFFLLVVDIEYTLKKQLRSTLSTEKQHLSFSNFYLQSFNLAKFEKNKGFFLKYQKESLFSQCQLKFLDHFKMYFSNNIKRK